MLAQATNQLRIASATPRLDAELLLAHTLGWSRARVLAERQARPTEAQQRGFTALIARRESLEPLAYIVGQQEFYGLNFEVTPATLVPRPETELLVDLALTWARGREQNQEPQNRAHGLLVADIGTGTGCIAVAFAANFAAAEIIAIDLSPEALAVARRNIARYGLASRVRLAEGDLLEPLNMPIDLLLSNPPYTILREIDENVRRHEPHLALDGGADGLALYRRLLTDAPTKLAQGGAIMLEIGATQGATVTALAVATFPNAHVAVHRDLAGHDRVVVIATRLISLAEIS